MMYLLTPMAQAFRYILRGLNSNRKEDGPKKSENPAALVSRLATSRFSWPDHRRLPLRKNLSATVSQITCNRAHSGIWFFRYIAVVDFVEASAPCAE